MGKFPKQYQQLLAADNKRAFAFLATVMADGSPQVTPVWFDVEGEFIRVNSARGRTKDINMVARPQVAVSIMDMDAPYDYLQIRGEVVEITEEGAHDHINALSMKYRGRQYDDLPAGQVRVTYKIKPTSLTD